MTIIFDETEHSFSTKNKKVGTRSMRWGNPNYTKVTEKVTSGVRHTTGIYGSNSAVEVIPPIYCFDSSAENNDNFQVKHA